jgi:hypothetical protein
MTTKIRADKVTRDESRLVIYRETLLDIENIARDELESSDVGSKEYYVYHKIVDLITDIT